MFKLLGKYFKDYKLYVICVVVFALAEAFGTAKLPEYFNDIVSNGVANSDMQYVWNVGSTMLIVTGAIAVCMLLSSYFSAYVTAAFTSRVRGDLFLKIQKFSELDFLRFSKESLLTRATSDSTQVQIVVINILRSVLSVPFLGVFALINCFRLNAMLSIIIVVAFIIGAFIVVRMTNKSIPIFTKLQGDVDDIGLLMNEKLTGIRSIRAFNRQEYEEEKVTAANEKAKKTALRANNLVVFVFPLVQIIMSISIVFILWFGSVQMQFNMVKLADLLTYIQYCLMLTNGLAMLGLIVSAIPKAKVAAQRMNEVLDYEPALNDNGKNVKVDVPMGEIEFKDIQFGYNGAQELVLNDVSFKIPAGKTTAIVGATGSGKSTLIKLILRFFDTNFFGSISIDGVNIKDMSTHDLREMISYAPQKSILFGGTIYDNLKVANKNATKEDAMHACDIAQVSEFLKSKNETEDMMLSQGGMNLSGGQRQRVSLARAFVKKAHIYLLDDSFSALDFKTEAAVRKAMYKELEGKTILIVAQRISTIMNADQIIVLDAGKVADMGTHKELLDKCKIYRQIYDTQIYQSEGTSNHE